MKKYIILIVFLIVFIVFIGCREKIDYAETCEKMQSEFREYYKKYLKPELEKIAQDITGLEDISIIEYVYLSEELERWRGEKSVGVTVHCAFYSSAIDQLIDDEEHCKELLIDFERSLDSYDYIFTFTYGKENKKSAEIVINIDSVTSTKTIMGFGHRPERNIEYFGVINGDSHYISMTDYDEVLQVRIDGQLIKNDEEDVVAQYNYNEEINWIESSDESMETETTSDKIAVDGLEKCPNCGGAGVVKFYYGSSDLEAILSGHDPYELGECPMCDGTGL